MGRIVEKVADGDDDSLASSKSNSSDDVVRLDEGKDLHRVFLECWTKPTGLFVYSDEVCHLSWYDVICVFRNCCFALKCRCVSVCARVFF